jgi:alpha-L-rhamnosidase
MTSSNHFAFGSLGKWIYRVIGGLAPKEPGWKIIEAKARAWGGITKRTASYLSPYGLISSQWTVSSHKGFSITITVPPNSKAEITMPKTGKAHNIGSGTWTFWDRTFTS